jgi:hypothetical protein
MHSKISVSQGCQNFIHLDFTTRRFEEPSEVRIKKIMLLRKNRKNLIKKFCFQQNFRTFFAQHSEKKGNKIPNFDN